MATKAVIFDLDGVIVSTDEYHYQAWKQLADEEGIVFDRTINERLRGVSRMVSLDILLENSPRPYTPAQENALAERKNRYYRRMLDQLSPADVLPGVLGLFQRLKHRGVKIAVASSSKNSPTILERIGLADAFDAAVDGNDIRKSKPDPEVFLLAAKRLGLKANECVVVEDAAAGVEAALAGGMKVLAVGSASSDPRATFRAKTLADMSIDDILGRGGP